MSNKLLQEEHFGILTDDELYLDCILLRSADAADDDLDHIRVWVPHFPLTKSSTLICARQEVVARGPHSQTAHLVFDLRGTGLSDGSGESTDFAIDLRSIRLWAEERFGSEVRVTFMGLPVSKYGRVNLLPLRSGVVMETIYYPPTDQASGPPILYLSSFGSFDRFDDVRCAALAHLGYEIYGLDPLRYLLHASATRPLTPADLLADFQVVLDIIGSSPVLVGQPLGAGLALMWAAQTADVKGVIAIGQAQSAFKLTHIFPRGAAASFDLNRAVTRITPRPVIFVWPEDHPQAGSKKEMADLYKNTGQPKKIERVGEISPKFLQNQLIWIAQNGG